MSGESPLAAPNMAEDIMQQEVEKRLMHMEKIILQENPLGNHANDIILDSTLDICLSRGET
jgi:hypothetical protein